MSFVSESESDYFSDASSVEAGAYEGAGGLAMQYLQAELESAKAQLAQVKRAATVAASGAAGAYAASSAAAASTYDLAPPAFDAEAGDNGLSQLSAFMEGERLKSERDAKSAITNITNLGHQEQYDRSERNKRRINDIAARKGRAAAQKEYRKGMRSMADNSDTESESESSGPEDGAIDAESEFDLDLGVGEDEEVVKAQRMNERKVRELLKGANVYRKPAADALVTPQQALQERLETMRAASSDIIESMSEVDFGKPGSGWDTRIDEMMNQSNAGLPWTGIVPNNANEAGLRRPRRNATMAEELVVYSINSAMLSAAKEHVGKVFAHLTEHPVIVNLAAYRGMDEVAEGEDVEEREANNNKKHTSAATRENDGVMELQRAAGFRTDGAEEDDSDRPNLYVYIKRWKKNDDGDDKVAYYVRRQVYEKNLTQTFIKYVRALRNVMVKLDRAYELMSAMFNSLNEQVKEGKDARNKLEEDYKAQLARNVARVAEAEKAIAAHAKALERNSLMTRIMNRMATGEYLVVQQALDTGNKIEINGSDYHVNERTMEIILKEMGSEFTLRDMAAFLSQGNDAGERAMKLTRSTDAEIMRRSLEERRMPAPPAPVVRASLLSAVPMHMTEKQLSNFLNQMRDQELAGAAYRAYNEALRAAIDYEDKEEGPLFESVESISALSAEQRKEAGRFVLRDKHASDPGRYKAARKAFVDSYKKSLVEASRKLRSAANVGHLDGTAIRNLQNTLHTNIMDTAAMFGINVRPRRFENEVPITREPDADSVRELAYQSTSRILSGARGKETPLFGTAATLSAQIENGDIATTVPKDEFDNGVPGDADFDGERWDDEGMAYETNSTYDLLPKSTRRASRRESRREAAAYDSDASVSSF